MYYEEKVVNGKLCFRTIPRGEWQEISYEVLLTKYLDKKKQLDRINILSEQDGPEQPWEDGTLGEDESTAKLASRFGYCDCGGVFVQNSNEILTSSPPQYYVKCLTCGAKTTKYSLYDSTTFSVEKENFLKESREL